MTNYKLKLYHCFDQTENADWNLLLTSLAPCIELTVRWQEISQGALSRSLNIRHRLKFLLSYDTDLILLFILC